MAPTSARAMRPVATRGTASSSSPAAAPKRAARISQRAIESAIGALDTLSLIHKDMQLQTAQTFLLVAAHGGEMMQAQLTGFLSEDRELIAQSSLSRNLALLGDGITSIHAHRRRPGLGLVRMFPNPTNRRENIIALTPKGEALAAAITEAMEGDRK